MQHAHTDALIGRLASAFNLLGSWRASRSKHSQQTALTLPSCALFAYLLSGQNVPACVVVVLKFYSSPPRTES